MTDYHQPVLLNESIEGLAVKPDGIYVDATFGGGGHSQEILDRLINGKLIAIDQDQDALANLPDDNRVIFVQHNFRYLKNFLKYHQIKKIDGLIADLGVSSHHFDSPFRGFSFRFEGALDMRMNQKAEFSAAELLNNYSEKDLARIFFEYGELKNSRKLAAAIVRYRQNQAIGSVRDMLAAISGTLPRHYENQFLAKVFQSIRLEVNQEIASLKELLTQTLGYLSSGGRLVVISYHSLEDRIVKNFMRYGRFDSNVEKDLYGNFYTPFRLITKKVITPGAEEISMNSRARSARLRIAEKI